MHACSHVCGHQFIPTERPNLLELRVHVPSPDFRVIPSSPDMTYLNLPHSATNTFNGAKLNTDPQTQDKKYIKLLRLQCGYGSSFFTEDKGSPVSSSFAVIPFSRSTIRILRFFIQHHPVALPYNPGKHYYLVVSRAQQNKRGIKSIGRQQKCPLRERVFFRLKDLVCPLRR